MNSRLPYLPAQAVVTYPSRVTTTGERCTAAELESSGRVSSKGVPAGIGAYMITQRAIPIRIFGQNESLG